MWSDEAEEVSDQSRASSCAEPHGIWLGSEDSDVATDNDSYKSDFVLPDSETESEGEGYGSGWSLADEGACVTNRVPVRRRAVVHDSDSSSDLD